MKLKEKYTELQTKALVPMMAISSAVLPSAVRADGTDLSNIGIDSSGKLTGVTDDGMGMIGGFQTILDQSHVLISGITGVAAAVLVAIFIIKVMKLAQASDNANERSRAITGLIFLLICAALLGSASLITGMFWNAFTGA